jgi:uncharacterized membrane protein HdeD (DUF308 family)
MSVQAGQPRAQLSSDEKTVRFAGILLMVVGITNVIYGIAAVDDANVYVKDAHYVFGNLETWGWVLLVTGVLQAITGLGVARRRSQFARWAGVAFVSLNLLGQLLKMPDRPLLALTFFAVDVLLLFALVVYADPEYVG